MISSQDFLSDALKRRCLHPFIGYPDEQRELEIIRLKVPELQEALAAQVVAVIRRLRALDLRKAPSISETLDWAKALVLLDADALTPTLLEETLHLLIKYERDTQQVNERLSWIAEPLQTEGQTMVPTPAEAVLRPPRHPAEPVVNDTEQRQQEHTARYFTSYRGLPTAARVDDDGHCDQPLHFSAEKAGRADFARRIAGRPASIGVGDAARPRHGAYRAARHPDQGEPFTPPTPALPHKRGGSFAEQRVTGPPPLAGGGWGEGV